MSAMLSFSPLSYGLKFFPLSVGVKPTPVCQEDVRYPQLERRFDNNRYKIPRQVILCGN